MAVQAELLKRLKLREEYDGAQDYDLVLRVVDEVYRQGLSFCAFCCLWGRAWRRRRC